MEGWPTSVTNRSTVSLSPMTVRMSPGTGMASSVAMSTSPGWPGASPRMMRENTRRWSYCSLRVPRSGSPGGLDPDGHAVELGRGSVLDDGGERLARGRHPHADHGGEQHAQDAEQVGDGVADRGLVRRPGLGGRGEGGGVGEGARVDAGQDRPLEAQRVRGQDGDDAAEQQGADDDAEGAAAGAHGGEEGRSRAHADDVGEQGQAEHAEDLRQPEAVVVRREGQRGEQDRGGSEREALDLDRADRAADGHDDRQQQQGLLRGDVGVAAEDLADVHGRHCPPRVHDNVYMGGVRWITVAQVVQSSTIRYG